eukprot:7048888-Alexandrium_andersonii.AAC.1
MNTRYSLPRPVGDSDEDLGPNESDLALECFGRILSELLDVQRGKVRDVPKFAQEDRGEELPPHVQTVVVRHVGIEGRKDIIL